jgi:hypothetical protein
LLTSCVYRLTPEELSNDIGYLLRSAAYGYTDASFGINNRTTRLFRIEYLFGLPYCIDGVCYEEYNDRSAEQGAIFTSWIAAEFFPFLNTLKSPNIDIIFGGDMITDYEIFYHLKNGAMRSLVRCALLR